MSEVLHTFPSLTPYFTVKNADGFIEFMGKVFNATLIKENRYEDGTIQHARLLIGENMIMLNQATDQYLPNTSQMHLYVDDIEKTYDLALKNGAKCLMKPMMRPHGDRMAGFNDPAGNIWWVAER